MSRSRPSTRTMGLIANLLLLLFYLVMPTSSTARPVRRVTTGDVVINEVAWMGTAASFSDEWIELHNTTTRDIDLTGWVLQGSDNNTPNILLRGNITAGGFFLLERTDDTTVSNIEADQIYTGDLINTGESLTLQDVTSQVIDTANGDSGAWPAGDNATKSAMERINALAPDSDTNWATNNGIIRNGLDANGNPLNGTPKARNSVSEPPTLYADLQVMKIGPHNAAIGDTLTYTLRISNGGQLSATTTRVTDTLPTGITFVSGTPAPSQHMEQVLIWDLGDLEPGSSRQITVTGSITTSAPTTLVNRLNARTPVTEGSLLNNVTCWTTTLTATPPPIPEILINAVHFDGVALLDTDEAVQLLNSGTTTVTLTGWELCKISSGNYACRTLPLVEIRPRDHVWFARDLTAFQRAFGFAADYWLSPWLSSGLANTGDEVILRDATHRAVDSLVFGSGDLNAPEWSGEALTVYQNNVGRAEGQILHRIPDEISGLPITDTNTLADWMQASSDVARGRRVVYPGWDFVSPFFWPAKAFESATLVVGVTPDNGFEIISQTLALALESIKIEMYTLQHGDLTDLLLAKARAGVTVTVLLEGGPAGIGETDPRWQAELYTCQLLEEAGGKCYFLIHETEDRIFSRYAFIHAKFILVDDRWTVITSQNFGNASIPSDDKSNGTYGSRGVVIATDAPTVAARVAAIFEADCDPLNHNDILRWNTGSYSRYGMPTNAVDLYASDATSYTVTMPQPLVAVGNFAFELYTAPEAALRQSDALLGLLNRAGAGDTIYVQQLYEYPHWGSEPLTGPNLRLEAYIEAARRGAQVRILLNSGDFEHEYYDVTLNRATVVYANQLAVSEGLDLHASMGDPTAYGIHNKMVLVNLHNEGEYVHIGSLNGSESSNKINREIALQIRSNAAFAYLATVFLNDWYRSNAILLPLTPRSYTPPQYPLVSEVYYAAADTNREWVEIFNPTGQVVDLSGYKLGDAVAATDYEAMYQFPEGTLIQPSQVLVIAVSGAQTPAADLELVNDTDKPDMIRVPDWGTGNWTLANPGDQVLFLRPDGQPVDVIVWGTASYPGINAHPGVMASSSSLERFPPSVDTDDCALDFRERAAPSPGVLPQ